MNTSNDNLTTEEFADLLEKLGGLIVPKIKMPRRYIDLEFFFIEATNHVFNDSRLTRCIEHWVAKYGKLLSPARLKLLLSKKGIRYDGAALGALLSITDSKFPNGKFSNLTQLCSKKKNKKLFPFFKDTKHCDPRWMSYGIVAPIFLNNEVSHFLKSEKFMATIPELHLRLQGVPPIVSNIKSFFELYPNASMYLAAKETALTYAYVHKICKKYNLGKKLAA